MRDRIFRLGRACVSGGRICRSARWGACRPAARRKDSRIRRSTRCTAARSAAPWRPRGFSRGKCAFFPICAFASLLVIIATCLLFLSEFSGPDLSYTQYSTWKDGPEVTCPGLPRVTLPR